MSLGQPTSSALLYCEPSTAPVMATVTETFTKVWEYTAWAACPTAEWPATYTIKEICTGDPDVWTQPAAPPNFIKTVVTCDVCEQKTQTITCPVEEAVQTGAVTIYGNGITATPAWAPAQPTGSPDSGMGPGSGSNSGPGSGPGIGPGGDSGPGAGNDPDSGSAPGSGAPAPGTGPDSSIHTDAGAGGDSPAGAPVPAFNNNNNGNAGPGSSPDSGPGSSPAPDYGAGPGPDAALAPGGDEADGSSPTLVTPQSNAGADAASSPHVNAGAPSSTSTLLLVSSVFLLVSSSFVCC